MNTNNGTTETVTDNQKITHDLRNCLTLESIIDEKINVDGLGVDTNQCGLGEGRSTSEWLRSISDDGFIIPAITHFNKVMRKMEFTCIHGGWYRKNSLRAMLARLIKTSIYNADAVPVSFGSPFCVGDGYIPKEMNIHQDVDTSLTGVSSKAFREFMCWDIPIPSIKKFLP